MNEDAKTKAIEVMKQLEDFTIPECVNCNKDVVTCQFHTQLLEYAKGTIAGFDAALKEAENTIEQIRLRLSMASFENRLGESVVNEVTDDELKRLRGKE